MTARRLFFLLMVTAGGALAQQLPFGVLDVPPGSYADAVHRRRERP